MTVAVLFTGTGSGVWLFTVTAWLTVEPFAATIFTTSVTFALAKALMGPG